MPVAPRSPSKESAENPCPNGPGFLNDGLIWKWSRGRTGGGDVLRRRPLSGCFFPQAIDADCPCREAVRKAMIWLWETLGKNISPNSSAYCQARKRLRATWLRELYRQARDRIEDAVVESNRWLGRNVIVIDGSSVSMPDTAENQAAYPQPKAQKPGCGFPVARLVAGFSLATGVMTHIVWDALSVGERSLFHRIWDRLKEGDVVLADRGFCGYADYWMLMQRGVDCVMRKHQRRTCVREVRRIGRGDRIVDWIKTAIQPKWVDGDSWDAIPDTLRLREISFRVDIPGFRTESVTVTTTLLDEKIYPTRVFADLYRRRWLAELFLRDVKISLSMDVLRCKTPDMADKEIWMRVIAYNLVRALMFEAAVAHGVSCYRISFKGTVSTIRQWAPRIEVMSSQKKRKKAIKMLLRCLAKDLLPDRPNRTEPRALKRRMKNYQLLTKPRKVFKEAPHRSRYRKP